MVHMDRRDLVIVIGGVVIDALICIAAGGVNGNLILSVFDFAAATLLIHCAENVEKLADAFRFRIAGNRICPDKSGTHKARLGGKVAGETQCAHSPAVGSQRKLR